MPGPSIFEAKPGKPPPESLLCGYAAEGAYTDCYSLRVDFNVSLSQYIVAFYTTSIFRLERLILQLAVSRPSSDAEVTALADGEIDDFAAWRVENRLESQLLMSDYLGRTRSWLMVQPERDETGDGTRLYFGSVIIPKWDSKKETRSLGHGFKLLLGFHKLYSRILLGAARRKLEQHAG